MRSLRNNNTEEIVSRRETEELISIGKIGSSVGLRGEVRVTLYAHDSGNLKEGKVLLLKHAGRTGSAASHAAQNDLEVRCTGVRLQKDRPVIRLEGITDRDIADSLRGMEIYIREEQLEELPEGQHYVRNLIGCTVRDIASGTDIGTLSDVIQNTAQSILEVEREGAQPVLIPAVDAFMRRIDEEERLIEVELIPGFLD